MEFDGTARFLQGQAQKRGPLLPQRGGLHPTRGMAYGYGFARTIFKRPSVRWKVQGSSGTREFKSLCAALRASKLLKLGSRLRLNAHVNAYNVANSRSIISPTTAFGPERQQPTAALDARMFQ